MVIKNIILLVLINLLLTGNQLYGQFYAYYTHIQSNELFEKYSRTGEFADIVVVMKDMKFVFWRGTSYLPYLETKNGKWKVEELVSRKGDGTAEMPDAVNRFSHVAIIENTKDKIVILWRYLPQFLMNKYPYYPLNVNQMQLAEEVFTIYPNGNIERKLQSGCDKIDQWNSTENFTIQLFKLTENGFSNLKTIPATFTEKQNKISGNPVKANAIEKAAIEFHFDEAVGDATIESISHSYCEVSGHKTYWRKGISGTALQLDGYSNLIKLDKSKAPFIKNEVTVQAWLAIAAYPWNQLPLVQQGEDNAYALMLDSKGFASFKIFRNKKTEELKSKVFLERNRWYCLTGTFNAATGILKIYVNGNLTDSLATTKERFSADLTDVRIGSSGITVAASDPVREDVNFPTLFTFDGLIDEICVFPNELSAGNIKQNFDALNPGNEAVQNPDLKIRKLPVIENPGSFRGYYTNLKYFETWDNLWRFGKYPDVVVESDLNPVKFIFWKGVNYIPCIVNDKNQYYSNEFNETWYTSGGSGCQEPMSDKMLLTTHARIIENSPARVVVQWRVALMDTKNNIQANNDTITHWGDWTDWIYYIYPDGLAVKHMRLYTSGQLNHEWQEGMVIIGENTHPEEVIEQSPVYFYVNDRGAVNQYDWKNAFTQKIDYPAQRIFVANLKSDWDPFTICDFTGGDIYNNNEYRPYSVFCNWNHWPTSMIRSDGRFSGFPDRASHSSLNHIFWDLYRTQKGDVPYYEKIMIEGMSNKKAGDLYPLSCSWLNPPLAKNIEGTDKVDYLPEQKVFNLEFKNKTIKFTIEANKKQPLVNPCITVTNWNSDKPCTLFVNGLKKHDEKLFRQGIVRDTNGKQKLVVWFELVSEKETDFELKK